MKRLWFPLTLLVLLAAFHLYSHADSVELTAANTVIFNEPIDIISMKNLQAEVMFTRVLVPEGEGMYLLLVSPGGDYRLSLQLKAFLDEIPGLVMVCKYCASASGMLFGTFPGLRYVTEESDLLMHEMYLEHVTSAVANNPKLAPDLARDSDHFNELLYKKIGMTKEAYLKKIVGTEWTLTGKDIVKNKLADKVVKFTCDNYMKVAAPRTCGQTK